uniref:Nucleosome assembly protein 1-like 1 n=1 Tax=Eptatretus burgeri TaxID=7764 RepID=A0A8C4QGU1_EPTBU
MNDSEAQPKVRQVMEDKGHVCFINSLPVRLRQRLWALRGLKAKEMLFEVDFYQQLHDLERNLTLRCSDLHERRKQIVLGNSEPTEEELSWHTFRNGDISSFQLDFCFSPNEYFSNSTLTKTYHMKNEFDSSSLLSFDGPEIISCTGCSIAWYKGRNVTVFLLHKKQKHRSRGTVRTVTKEFPNDSFFHFFNPPKVSLVEKTMDAENAMILAADFQIGQLFREEIVPKAVLYFTGEAIEYEENEDEDEPEESEDESESEYYEGAEYDDDEDVRVEEECEEDS